MRLFLKFPLSIGFLLLSITVFAQTGPGGVGNSSTNKIWLDASKLTGLSNGGKVSQWNDASGNNWHASQGSVNNQPTYLSSSLNGKPVIHFDRSQAAQFLEINTATLGVTMSSSYSLFVMAKANSGGAANTNSGIYQDVFLTGGYLSGIYFSGYSNNNQTSTVQWLGNEGNNPVTHLYNRTNNELSTWYLTGMLVNEVSSGTTVKGFSNGASMGTQASTLQIADYSTINYARIGAAYPSGEWACALNGDIAEIILYNTALNDAQRIIVENYLTSKYGLSIANRYYANDPYNQDVQGIGTTDGVNKHTQAGSGKGLLLKELNNSLNAANEFLLAGHNRATNSEVSTDIPAGVTQRWQRDWYLQKTGTIDASLAFDWSQSGLTAPADLANNAASYCLLYRADLQSPFSMVTVNNTILTGRLENEDQLSFNVSDAELKSGYYTIGKMAPYVWTGRVSNEWNTAGNWSTSSVPTISSHVVVPVCTTCPILPATVTIQNLTISGGKLDLSSNSLLVTQATDLQLATIISNQGSIQSLDFSEVKNNTFQGGITFIKTGGNNNTWYGGNTFQGKLKVQNQSTASISPASQANDFFNH